MLQAVRCQLSGMSVRTPYACLHFTHAINPTVCLAHARSCTKGVYGLACSALMAFPSRHGIALHRLFSQCGNNTCDPTGDQSPTLARPFQSCRNDRHDNIVATLGSAAVRGRPVLAAAAFKQAPLQRQVAPPLCRQQLPEHCAVSWHNRFDCSACCYEWLNSVALQAL